MAMVAMVVQCVNILHECLLATSCLHIVRRIGNKPAAFGAREHNSHQTMSVRMYMLCVRSCCARSGSTCGWSESMEMMANCVRV